MQIRDFNKTKAVAFDCDEYAALLYTAPGFGCVQYEARGFDGEGEGAMSQFTINVSRRLVDNLTPNAQGHRTVHLPNVEPRVVPVGSLPDPHELSTMTVKTEAFCVEQWVDGNDRFLMIIRESTGERQRANRSGDIRLTFTVRADEGGE